MRTGAARVLHWLCARVLHWILCQGSSSPSGIHAAIPLPPLPCRRAYPWRHHTAPPHRARSTRLLLHRAAPSPLSGHSAAPKTRGSSWRTRGWSRGALTSRPPHKALSSCWISSSTAARRVFGVGRETGRGVTRLCVHPSTNGWTSSSSTVRLALGVGRGVMPKSLCPYFNQGREADSGCVVPQGSSPFNQAIGQACTAGVYCRRVLQGGALHLSSK